MPPISGWGMGIDRVLQVLLGTRNIRDTVMFPLMRPEPYAEKTAKFCIFKLRFLHFYAIL